MRWYDWLFVAWVVWSFFEWLNDPLRIAIKRHQKEEEEEAKRNETTVV